MFANSENKSRLSIVLFVKRYFFKTINCSKPCSDVEWLVLRHFKNISWQFWFKLLLHTFWCIAMHPQRLFLLYVASNSRKRYWDCKLPSSIEAQIELSSPFVNLWPENEHKRQLCEEFAPQPGGTNDNDAHVCEPICIFYLLFIYFTFAT